MSDYTDVLLNTQTLLSHPSVTPNDGGSHLWLMSALNKLGYKTSEINHGDVKNFLAIPKGGLNKQTILFVGHTDVVPANEAEWKYPPFNPTWDNDILYGRGAVDMKSSIAAMLASVATLQKANHSANVAFLITSNEEGESNFGIEYVLKHHKQLFTNVHKVLIGEPTSNKHLGDTIKIGRRGSINLKINIVGKSGHVAYPSEYHNPLDLSLKIASKLNLMTWGKPYDHFDQSKMTIVSMQTNSNVFNATASLCELKINWRFNPSLSIQNIKDTINALCNNMKEDHYKIECHWLNQGKPFFNSRLNFAHQIKNAIQPLVENDIIFSTSGGTSDARFFNTDHFELVELGPRNYSAHKVDEHISKKDLITLKNLYLSIIKADIISYNNPDHQVL